MNKLLNYIKKGRGIGAIIILFISVLCSVYISLSVRKMANISIPYIQLAANEILPLKIDNGVITVPENTKKIIPIYSNEKDEDYSFVIDTTVDSFDASKQPSGLYLTRSYFYVVDSTSGEVKSQKLKGNLYLEKKDYKSSLQSYVKWIVIGMALISIISFFLLYFILTLFYSFCAGLALKLNNKHLNFDAKMRLSAVCFVLVLIASFVLNMVNIELNSLLFFLAVILLQVVIIKKIPQ